MPKRKGKQRVTRKPAKAASKPTASKARKPAKKSPAKPRSARAPIKGAAKPSARPRLKVKPNVSRETLPAPTPQPTTPTPAKPAKPRAISDRTWALYLRWTDPNAVARYIARKPRTGRTWARALAIHARQKVYQAASVSVVRKEETTHSVEYWFRQRLKISLQSLFDTDDYLLAPTALKNVAELISIKLGKPWLDCLPVGVRAFFVIEIQETSVNNISSGKRSIISVGSYDLSCTPKRSWIESRFGGLPGEVDEWLKAVSSKYPTAYVLGFRTHVWYSWTLAQGVKL